MQSLSRIAPRCSVHPSSSVYLQCVVTFKDRSLDLIAPHAHGIAALMLASARNPLAMATKHLKSRVYRWCVAWASYLCPRTPSPKSFMYLVLLLRSPCNGIRLCDSCKLR
jgi:hypothetical protein